METVRRVLNGVTGAGAIALVVFALTLGLGGTALVVSGGFRGVPGFGPGQTRPETVKAPDLGGAAPTGLLPAGVKDIAGQLRERARELRRAERRREARRRARRRQGSRTTTGLPSAPQTRPQAPPQRVPPVRPPAAPVPRPQEPPQPPARPPAQPTTPPPAPRPPRKPPVVPPQTVPPVTVPPAPVPPVPVVPPVTTPPVTTPSVPDQVPQVPGVQIRSTGRGPGSQAEPVRPDRDPADYDLEDVPPQ